MSEILNKQLEEWYSQAIKMNALPKHFRGDDHHTLREMAWLTDKDSEVYSKGYEALAQRLRVNVRSVANRIARLVSFGLLKVVSEATSKKTTRRIVFTLPNTVSALSPLETSTLPVERHPTKNQETMTEPRRSESDRPDISRIFSGVEQARQAMDKKR